MNDQFKYEQRTNFTIRCASEALAWFRANGHGHSHYWERKGLVKKSELAIFNLDQMISNDDYVAVFEFDGLSTGTNGFYRHWHKKTAYQRYKSYEYESNRVF